MNIEANVKVQVQGKEEVDGAAASFEKLGSSAAGSVPGIQGVNNGLGGLKDSAGGGAAGMLALGGGFAVANQAAQQAIALYKDVAAAIVEVTRVSLQASAEYERSMIKVEALTGAQPALVNEWKTSLLDLSQATGRLPNELAEGLYFVASAGLKGKEAMEVLQVSAQMAAAGMGETANIARSLTSAINAYGKENLSAAQAADILTKTVIEGGADAKEYANSLGRILPIASQLGVSLQEVGAFMAVFTREGVSGQEAATALRGALQNLAAPSKEAVESLGRMGITVDRLKQSIQQDGLRATLQELVAIYQGNTTELDKVIGNVRALTGVLAVTGQQADEYKATLDSITASQGTLNTVTEKTKEGLDFKWDQVVAQAKSLAISFGDDLAPAAKILLDVVKDLKPEIALFAQAFAQWTFISTAAASIQLLADKLRELKSAKDAIVDKAGWVANAGPFSAYQGGLYLPPQAPAFTGDEDVPMGMGVFGQPKKSSLQGPPGPPSEKAIKEAEKLRAALYAIDNETDELLRKADAYEAKIASNLDKASAEISRRAAEEEKQALKGLFGEKDLVKVGDLDEAIYKNRVELAKMVTAQYERQLYLAQQIAETFGSVGSTLTSAAELLSTLGIGGGIVENLEALGSGLQRGAQAAADGLLTWSEMLGGLKDAFKAGAEGGVGAGLLGGAGQGAAMGAMFGPMGAAIGAGAGALMGLLGGIFGKPEYKKVMEDVGKSWGVSISEGLAKQIAATEKDLGVSRQMAELLNISGIMGESGLDPSQFADKINNLMEAVALGAVPAKEGIAELGKAFLDLKTAADGGSVASEKAMIDMIKRARELGQSIPEMDAAIKGMLGDATKGLEQFYAGLKPGKGGVSKEQAAANQEMFGATYLAQVAQLGAVGAAEAMQKAFEAMMKTLPKGTELTGGAADAAQMMKLLGNEAFRGAADAALGLSRALKGLMDSANLSQKTLDAFGTSTKSVYDQALDAAKKEGLGTTAAEPGGISPAEKAALEAVLPMLAQLQNAKALGGTISKEEEKMLADAQKAGILPLKDVATQQLEVQRQIRDALRGGAPVPAGSGTAPGAGSGTAPGGGPPGVPGMTGGGVASSNMLAMLHGTPSNPELVVPLQTLLQTMSAGIGAGIASQMGGGWSESTGKPGGAVSLTTALTVKVDGNTNSPDALAQFASLLGQVTAQNTNGAASALQSLMAGAGGP